MSTNGATTHQPTVVTLTAEVTALQVGSRQVTMSVFKQLDFAEFPKIEPMGRVRPSDKDSWGYAYNRAGIDIVGRSTETGALVRSFVAKPNWHRSTEIKAWHHWANHHYVDQQQLAKWVWVQVRQVGKHTMYWGRNTTTKHDQKGCLLPLSRSTETDAEHSAYPNREDYADDAAYQAAQDEVRAYNDELFNTKRWLDAEWWHRWRRGDLCGMAALRAEWEAEADLQAAELKAQQDAYDSAATLPLIVLAGLR